MATSQVFTEKEQADLDLARSVRTRIINEFTEDNLPTAFDLDRLITAVKDIEAGALSVAKIRIKQQEADGADVGNAIIATMLLDVNDARNTQDREPKIIEDGRFRLPDHLDKDVKPGEARVGTADKGLYEEIFGGGKLDQET